MVQQLEPPLSACQCISTPFANGGLIIDAVYCCCALSQITANISIQSSIHQWLVFSIAWATLLVGLQQQQRKRCQSSCVIIKIAVLDFFSSRLYLFNFLMPVCDVGLDNFSCELAVMSEPFSLDSRKFRFTRPHSKFSIFFFLWSQRWIRFLSSDNSTPEPA